MRTDVDVKARRARSRTPATRSAPLSAGGVSVGKDSLGKGLAPNLFDCLAIAILMTVAIVAALSFRDYGLGWDDYTRSEEHTSELQSQR